MKNELFFMQFTPFKLLLILSFQLCVTPVFSQSYEVIYAQLEYVFLDASLYDFSAKESHVFDTVGKWKFVYSSDKSITMRTEDSQYERKRVYFNKKTLEYDSFISYNMGFNNIQYHDYQNNQTKQIRYFFDLKYVIEDNIPTLQWSYLEGEKVINGYQCKRATTREPEPLGGLFFDVWYTEEIPVSAGPLGLTGLPGLILEVKRNSVPFYTAVSIRELNEGEGIKIKEPETNETPITLAEYHKIRMGVPFENYNTPPPGKKELSR